MRLVIVGGVGGGMSCAARARRLMEDAEIIILEKNADVSVATCGFPYFLSGEIQDERVLRVQTPASLKAALNLDVRVGHEAVEIDAQSRRVRMKTPQGESWLEYDALVLAVGAEAVPLGLREESLPQIHTLRSIEDAQAIRALAEERGGHALVIGAGFIGAEAAENLAAAGLQVDLVEAGPQILPAFDPQTVHPLRRELRSLGVTVREGVAVTSLRQVSASDACEDDNSLVEVILADGVVVRVDQVVVAAGIRPLTELALTAGVKCVNGAIDVDEAGRTSVEGIWAVGDATLSEHAVTGASRPVALAGPANRAGRLVADDIACDYGYIAEGFRIARPLGTAIIRVGTLMAATTGANKAALDAAGVEYHAILTVANDHVGYYPGATPMFLTVYIDANGEILGAQGVGRKGIDRRIDVIATAIRAGMPVEDLIDLDLCYSPPYGSAKDAVNVVGMIGQNLCDGLVEMWQPWDLQRAQREWAIVDVRRPEEAAAMRIPGSLCVPHTQVRERIEEIKEFAQGRPVALHCKSGFRSYLAYRVLKAQGIEAMTMSGGIDVLENYLGDQAKEVLVYGRINEEE